jgi:V8-like Glu-specific endopeptidase
MGSLGTYESGNWSHKCGATLIDHSKVITAAHCVVSEKKVIQA